MITIAPQTTDEELMRLYLQAHLPAFEELYKRHAGKLLSYLQKKVSSREVAEELLQDVFSRMHAAKLTYKDSYLFLPWIFTIARHTLIDYYKRAETKVASFAEELDESTFVLETSNSREASPLLETLSPQQKRIFELRYLKEWSFEQISKDTELSPANIRQIISRGIKFLKTKASEQ